MSEDQPSKRVLQRRVEALESQVEGDHEPRITRNERYRLQMMGALKVIGFILGAGGLTYLLTLL